MEAPSLEAGPRGRRLGPPTGGHTCSNEEVDRGFAIHTTYKCRNNDSVNEIYLFLLICLS